MSTFVLLLSGGNQVIVLGGHEFEGPVPLDEWGRNGRPSGIYAICRREQAGAARVRWRPLFIGELVDATWPGFPRSHPAGPWWAATAGGWERLGIAFHPMPAPDPRHRASVVRLLVDTLRPRCNGSFDYRPDRRG
ncbi:MAG: hypothetical protein AMS20_06820 [Gemmatimonas sp. SG8_28]|nr:MAG: hypothetical protein AMS20_06820 [Gemmatimonas sp. SG8_28]